MFPNIPDNTKTAIWEATKEAARWIVSLVVGWFLTETLKQIDLVPEFAQVQLWVFTYMIPVRFVVQTTLTLATRMVDKFIHEWNGTKFKGVIPF